MAEPDRKGIPKLVGVTKAAEMLDTNKSNISRFVELGILPKPIQVEGGHPVWPKPEIARAARALKARRRRRETARQREEERS